MTGFDPFDMHPMSLEDSFIDWDTMYPRSYRKEETDPYTKCRIVLMNGTEFEAQWFSRNFSRRCQNEDLRRELAVVRRIEQQQQKRISCLKPKNESILEHTIAYEQLAVDLTAALAKLEESCEVKNALNFALLEDFDHLYRYANLLDAEYGIDPQRLVGGYTEIMPARPTIAEHRHPIDSVFNDVKTMNLQTKLNIGIITAAEQQTMNYYMNTAPFYDRSDLGRRLYQEIGMIEEEHVTQYESLKDTSTTWLEELLLHEYTECYLYYSCYETECDPYIRRIWEQCLMQEIAHLHKACELLQKYEKKDRCQVIPDGRFPSVLKLGSNIPYVRAIIEKTTGNTQRIDQVVALQELNRNAPFYQYQAIVNRRVDSVASHNVIDLRIRKKGMDYRFQTAPHPIAELRGRRKDNTQIAREVSATPVCTTVCGKSDDCCKCTVMTREGNISF